MQSRVEGRTHGRHDQPAQNRTPLANGEPSTHGWRGERRKIAYHQSISDIIFVLIAKMSVLGVPLSGFQIIRQSRKALLQPLKRSDRRAPRPDPLVQICLHPAPTSGQETVRAIMRNQDWLHRHRGEPFGIKGHLGHLTCVERHQFGQVVFQPRPVRRIKGKPHNWLMRHSPHLAQARSLVGPMVDSQNCHRHRTTDFRRASAQRVPELQLSSVRRSVCLRRFDLSRLVPARR